MIDLQGQIEIPTQQSGEVEKLRRKYKTSTNI